MYSYAQIVAATQESGPARPAVARAELTAAATRGEMAPLLAELRADAARRAALPELPYHLYRTYGITGDRAQYEGRYFARRRALNSAAIVAIIDGGGDDLMWLSDVIWSICDEYSWAVPAHHRFNTTLGETYDRCIDLFAAETAHALAEIVTILEDDLDDAVTQRVRAEISRRVLTPFLDDPRSRWWETSLNNWAAVCAGAVGMAGLALEDDPMRLAALVDRVQRTMNSFLSGFTADGGCPEGMDYWAYGYGYFVYYAEALRDRTGLDLLTPTSHIAGFPATIDFGNGKCVSFSDGSDRMMPPTGLMSRLRQRLGVRLPQLMRLSNFEDDHCYRWAHLSRTLLWTDESVVGSEAPSGTGWLPELAWVIDRTTVDDIPVVFAAKGGNNDEPHNHLDLGGFILAVDGEQLLCDLGSGVYDKDYFSPRRYQALHPSAEGHSVPVVAGRHQRPGRDEIAEVTGYRAGESTIAFSLDLSQAYGGHRVRRDFAWDRAGRLVLADEFDETDAPLEELFISRIAPLVNGSTVRWDGLRGSVILAMDASFEANVERIDTWDHHHAPETVYRLRLRGRTAPRHRFEFQVVT